MASATTRKLDVGVGNSPKLGVPASCPTFEFDITLEFPYFDTTLGKSIFLSLCANWPPVYSFQHQQSSRAENLQGARGAVSKAQGAQEQVHIYKACWQSEACLPVRLPEFSDSGAKFAQFLSKARHAVVVDGKSEHGGSDFAQTG